MTNMHPCRKFSFPYITLAWPTCLAILACCGAAAIGGSRLAAAEAIPTGDGQLRQPSALFDGGRDEQGRAFLLNGQAATNGKLILNASNGFFDSGVCRAAGESPQPRAADDESLIAPNFAYLGDWKKTDGSLRWHLWIQQPGQVRFAVRMRVSKAQAGSTIQVSFAGEQRTVRTSAAAESTTQPWELEFDVKQPGEQTLQLTATQIAAAGDVGQLFEIIAYGPAIENGKLLRARWRPAAVHGSYSSSSCPESRTWVMATRSTTTTDSYSPITTPFGYFGTSFDSNQRSTGGFNFSMWAAGKKGDAPPLQQMPHLLAAGSPAAEFSGFGHEGSGVKLRNWTAMPDRPQTVIQALRVENDGDYHTYYGYFWDDPSQHWKLYAVGRKWSGGKPIRNLAPGSFCEVPGPPQVERTGDLPREVARRGWRLDERREWHPLDQFHGSKKGGAPLNKSWSLTSTGEFAMTTGGMRYYPPVTTVQLKQTPALPEYLRPEATQQLFQLPARFALPEVVSASSSDATINLRLEAAGRDATVTLYYGEVDCLTFAPRELHATERNSAISQAGQSDERTWSHRSQPQAAADGDNLIRITGLSPGKTYYYRALVTNAQGQIWMFDSHSLQTK